MPSENMTDLEHRLYIGLGTLVNDPEYLDDTGLVRLFKQEHYDMALELLKEFREKFYG